MKYVWPSFVSGLILIGIGLSVIAGWYLHIPALISIVPSYINMVFNTALLFVFCGMTLCLTSRPSMHHTKVYNTFGALILIMSGLTIIEYLFSLSIGIDQLFMKVWIFDQNPFPGRMAINTACAFFLTGIIFSLFPYTHNRLIASIVQIAIICIVMLGLSAIIGYLLHLEFLYSWYQYTRMAIHTAIGFTVLGIGLGEKWANSENYLNLYKGRDDKRIILLSSIILVSIAIIAALSGFAFSSRYNEKIAKSYLNQELKKEINLFQYVINESLSEIDKLNVNDGNFENIKNILGDDVSAIKIEDTQRKALYSYGTVALDKEALSLNSPLPAKLLWNDKFYIQATKILATKNKQKYIVTIDIPLDVVNQSLSDHHVSVCGNDQLHQTVCIPGLNGSTSSLIFANSVDQQQLINDIRLNRSGIRIGKNDANQYIMAAFQYDNHLGLEFLIQTNISGIYTPMREQLEFAIPLIIFCVTLGILLLNWQVLPLIRQVVRSKKESQSANIRLNAILDNASEGIITLDSKNIIKSVNPTAAKMFGYSAVDLIDQSFQILLPDESRTRIHISIFEYLKKICIKVIGEDTVEMIVIHKSNIQFPVEIAIAKMYVDDAQMYVCIVHDISKRRTTEDKLAESELRFRLAFDESPIGIGMLSLAGRWTKVNNALCQILGFSESELLKMEYQSYIHPEDITLNDNYAKQLYNGAINNYQIDIRLICKNSDLIWVSFTVAVIKNSINEPLYYIAQIQNIGDKKKAQQALSYQAYYDALTGLVNRNQLEASLESAISTALNKNHNFAIFYMDIDHFKHINDTLGHEAGDEVLKIFGEKLKSNTRATDVAARIGGDEFIIVLNGVNNVEAAASIAEKIINSISQPVTINHHVIAITTSIGIGFYPENGTDCQTLIKSADMALYEAKKSGRNNYQFCTKQLNTQIHERVLFKNEINKALDDKSFKLVFLPKINLHNHKIIGFEVLLRWHHESYGDVSPAKIIPVIEEMGLISQLNEWIIKAACQYALQWSKAGYQLQITLNISNRQFKQKDFIDGITRILDEVKFSPKFLDLEICENLIMQDPEYSHKILDELRELGIHVTVDNFGTGYSSLKYLHQFAIDSIKVDRSFVKDIDSDDNQAEFLSILIGLIKSMGVRVSVEGIESRGQYDLITELGCDQGQGYYISPPIVENQVLHFLNTFENKSSMTIS